MPFEQSSASSSQAITRLKARLSNFETEQGRLSGLSYQPQSPEDIIITTTPKAGTTWMQQMCHQLRSGYKGGDMSFSEISEVVPWLELAHDQGQNLYAPQYGDKEGLPRLFKTHAWEPHCPKGCKTIVILRNPTDVVASFYHFFEDWFFESGSILMEEFAQEFWLQRGVPSSRMENASYFVHLVSWYKLRRDPNILIVCYEDMEENLERQVRRVAKFMSTNMGLVCCVSLPSYKLSFQHNFLTEDIIKGATHRSSFEFMKANASQFDEKLSKLARNEACGLPKDAGMTSSKLRRGTSGQTPLSETLQEQISCKWNAVVQPVTGCDNYDAVRAVLAKECEDTI